MAKVVESEPSTSLNKRWKPSSIEQGTSLHPDLFVGLKQRADVSSEYVNRKFAMKLFRKTSMKLISHSGEVFGIDLISDFARKIGKGCHCSHSRSQTRYDLVKLEAEMRGTKTVFPEQSLN